MAAHHKWKYFKEEIYKAIIVLFNLNINNDDFIEYMNELIKIDTLLHICEAFNIELYEFFYSPLYKDVHYEKN